MEDKIRFMTLFERQDTKALIENPEIINKYRHGWPKITQMEWAVPIMINLKQIVPKRAWVSLAKRGQWGLDALTQVPDEIPPLGWTNICLDQRYEQFIYRHIHLLHKDGIYMLATHDWGKQIINSYPQCITGDNLWDICTSKELLPAVEANERYLTPDMMHRMMPYAHTWHLLKIRIIEFKQETWTLMCELSQERPEMRSVITDNIAFVPNDGIQIIRNMQWFQSI